MGRKSDESKGNIKGLDPPEEGRRDYLKTVGALVAGLAVGGAAGWLARPAEKITETLTETVTKTVTVTPTPTPKPTPTPTPTPTPMEFKHGKSVMYLTPDIHETWWVACKEYLKRAVEADGWKFAFDVSDWSDSKCTDQLVTYSTLYDIIFVFPTSLEGINEGIRIAEVENHCPVVVQKNFVVGEYGRFCISFDDHGAGMRQVEMAVNAIKQRYGTTEGKKIICFSGARAASGWRGRAEGFLDGMKLHPEIEYEEWDCGASIEGWANQADVYFATDTCDAIVAGSGGPYGRGIIDALSRYGKLYYVGDPNHIYMVTIDGKPSELQWIRRGYQDDVLSQSPDCLMPIGWYLARDYIVKDASYQYPPYTMPSIPTPIEVGAPPTGYWGEGDPKMKIDKGLIFPQVSMPQGVSPVYTVNKDNVNKKEIWGNTYTFWRGKEDIQMLTWPAKGTPPAWSQKLLDDYEVMFTENYQW